ncbi:hypothetical protein MNBD_NITROSPINAE02-469 [hydrothermal vent metagenome]|uniref:Uncharacterized protein n=1 Tax=hydrothermal vent metagenome TaxID=652676 RepID=A0A3B1BSU6_9ZZZZ
MTDSIASFRWFNVAVYIALVAITIPFARFDVTFSVALGGFFALSSLLYLEYFLGLIFSHRLSAPMAKGLTLFSYYFRFAVIGFITYKLLIAGVIHVPSLLVGLSATTFAIFTWRLFVTRPIATEDYERTN